MDREHTVGLGGGQSARDVGVGAAEARAAGSEGANCGESDSGGGSVAAGGLSGPRAASSSGVGGAAGAAWGGRGLRRKLAAMEVARRVLARADLLPESERALVVAVLERGQPLHEVAALAGLTERGRGPGRTASTSRAAGRALRRITTRVMTAEFEHVRLNREHWPPAMARAASLMFLHGLTQAQAAAAMGTTLHAVRQHALAVRTLAARERAAARGHSPGPGRGQARSTQATCRAPVGVNSEPGSRT